MPPRSQYGLVPMPGVQVGNPLSTLSDIMSMAGGVQRMRANSAQLDEQEAGNASKKAIEQALQESGGSLPKTIERLESAGRWTEATSLRQRSAEIQKAQQEELAATHKRVREGLETATRYMQGIEATEDPAEKSRLFSTIRPQIVEMMPGFDQYIPQSFEDDPGFVSRAIPLGLSASEAAKRRSDALETLNATFKQGGEKLDRDKAVLESLTPFLDSAESGEEVEQALTVAENVYGASPAVRARIGDVPRGPLPPEWQASVTARLTSPVQSRDTSPASVDAAIVLADRKGDKAEVARLMALKARMGEAGREPEKPAGDTEPLVPIIGDDGKPVLVRRAQAEGRRPASTREQGRAVTSGDAGRIAELDTSLDDLKVMRSTLFPDANLSADTDTEKPTGTRAAIGAALPNWVTELTGWGEDAKSRQAVIDRVKQVIGKALEGGVLRKEDEIKYTKILPTIKDVPSVVKSKLDGLEQAIDLRRTRELDAREDAGYDVSRFRARSGETLDGSTAGPKPAAGGTVRMRAPNGQEANVPADQVDAAKAKGATVVQ